MCDAAIPFRIHNLTDTAIRGRSQLRRWEVIKMLGEVPGAWKISSFAYGYMHREPLLWSLWPRLCLASIGLCADRMLRGGTLGQVSCAIYEPDTAHSRCSLPS